MLSTRTASVASTLSCVVLGEARVLHGLSEGEVSFADRVRPREVVNHTCGAGQAGLLGDARVADERQDPADDRDRGPHHRERR